MSIELEHIQQALHNIEVIDYLCTQPKFCDWTSTVTFYTALHIVEAVFFHDTKNSNRRHGHNHEEREAILKNVNSYRNIYRHYRQLQSASVIARYLYNPSGTGVIFEKYMSAKKVKEKLIKHHLAQLIKTASKFISLESATLLKKAFNEIFK